MVSAATVALFFSTHTHRHTDDTAKRAHHPARRRKCAFALRWCEPDVISCIERKLKVTLHEFSILLLPRLLKLRSRLNVYVRVKITNVRLRVPGSQSDLKLQA